MMIRLSLDAAAFKSGLKDAMAAVTDFKSKVESIGKVVAGAAKAYVKLGTESIKWFANTAKAVVSASIKIGAAVGGITAAAVNMAGEFQALDSMFKQTFGSLTDTATKAMDKMAKETGVVSGRLKQGFTDMFMQLKGSGIESKEALGLTEKGMRLAADAAAAYNIPLEDAVLKLRSFIRGNTEAGDSIGLFTSESQRNTAAMDKYGKKWQKLTEAEKQNLMLDISGKIYKESGAMGQAAREADNLENVIGNLKFSFKEFLAVLGANMLGPAIASIKDFGAALDQTKNILADQGLMAAIDYMTKYISDKIIQMSDSIPKAMGQMISGITGFINSSLPAIMAAGGAIVQNIAKGIEINKGNISAGITSLIGQVTSWINQNMPAIEATGRTIINAIRTGLENNKDALHSAVYNITRTAVDLFLDYKTMIFQAGLEVGGEFIRGVWEGIWQAGSKYKPMNDNYWAPAKADASKAGAEAATAWLSSSGQVFTGKGPSLTQSLFSKDTFTSIQVNGQESGYAYINGVKTKIAELSPEVKTIVDNLIKQQGEQPKAEGTKTGQQFSDGVKEGINTNKEGVKATVDTAVNESTAGAKETAKAKGKEVGQATTDGAKEGLAQLSPAAAQEMAAATQALQQSATNMYNGAKVSFSSLANVARSSMSSMYNGVSTSFSSMANNARTACSSMYNGCKTSFVNLANVGRNQFSNLYNGASNSIRSLSYAVQGNMNTVRSAINIKGAVNSAISDFNRLRSALSKPINSKINISKTTTVSTVSKPAMLRSFAVMPHGVSASGAAVSSGKNSNSNNQHMTTAIYLDSKTIASQTAKYTDGAINKINTRRNRLGGVL
jgi:hypothetical protein